MSMEPESFDYICRLVREGSGIVLDPGKEYLVLARLMPLAKQEGMPSVDELVGLVRKASGSGLRSRVVEAMTTNETSFFRDIAPFSALEKRILPAVIEARRPMRSLSLWSAASSSGQELYSVAILLREAFPELRNWRVRLVGTDLSAAMVERAQSGRFTQLEVNRGLPAKYLAKHFERDGMDWVVREEIRKLVEFRVMNLALPWPSLGTFDIIMMRNVLIYFDLRTKQAILDKIHRVIAPDGYLLLGAAETTLGVDDRFKSREFERALYYRLANLPAGA